LRSDAGKVDRRLAVHPRRLRGVTVKLTGTNDAHAVVLPQGFVAVIVGMSGVAHNSPIYL
jgi:hypothetical protein